jgi:protoheme IX farnesyltransferase
VSLLPSMVGVSGRVYFWIALLLGSTIVWLSWRFAVTRSESVARALFFGSIIYLPLIWVVMILNH